MSLLRVAVCYTSCLWLLTPFVIYMLIHAVKLETCNTNVQTNHTLCTCYEETTGSKYAIGANVMLLFNTIFLTSLLIFNCVAHTKTAQQQHVLYDPQPLVFAEN